MSRQTLLTNLTLASMTAGGAPYGLVEDAAIAIANDRSGITSGDCSALISEIGTYFDRAAASVA